MGSGYALDGNGTPTYFTQTRNLPPLDPRSHLHDSTAYSPRSNGHAASPSLKLPLKGRARTELDGEKGDHASSTSNAQTSLVSGLLSGLLVSGFPLLCKYAWAAGTAVTMDDRDQRHTRKIKATITLRAAVTASLYTTSAIMLVCGLYGVVFSEPSPLDRRKFSDAAFSRPKSSYKSSLRGIAVTLGRTTSLTAMLLAALCLDPSIVATVVVSQTMLGIRMSAISQRAPSQVIGRSWVSFASLLVLSLAHISGFVPGGSVWTSLAGLSSLAYSTFCGPLSSLISTSTLLSRQSSWLTGRSPLTTSREQSTYTLTAGVVLVAAAIFVDSLLGSQAILTFRSAWAPFIVAMFALATFILVKPEALRARSSASIVVSSAIALAIFFHNNYSHRHVTLYLPQLLMLPLWTAYSCRESPNTSALGHIHDHDTRASRHNHVHLESAHNGQYSSFTSFLLARTYPGTLMHGILVEKDSRRIAYFTVLNFAFMLVQGFYGWVSGSLGLLSDTVHMFFDCLALIVGLAAAIASKWSTSPEKPYGWSKLNTLAGFGNGVFLMLVSVEFVWGAIEGIMEQNELRRVEELLVVSTLGLIVNMIGLLAFGHAHAGHDHGHGHGHGHSHGEHSHSHSHSDSNTHSHALPHSHSPSHSHSHSHTSVHAHDHSHEHSHEHGHHRDHKHDRQDQNPIGLIHPRGLADQHDHVHGHDHSPVPNGHHRHAGSETALRAGFQLRDAFATPLSSPMHPPGRRQSLYPPTESEPVPAHSGHKNENMHGIYLHIAADAGGSLAVIISTTLTLWKPWYLWDPLATILIAILIFMAAVPLVKESARKLLMVIPEELEYELKTTMQELVMLRGVTGFAAPRFWVEDRDSDDGHGHGHHHHDHGHSDDHASHDDPEGSARTKLQGTLHVFISRTASVEDVQQQVDRFFHEKGMDIVTQIERDGDGRCWCGGTAGNEKIQ